MMTVHDQDERLTNFVLWLDHDGYICSSCGILNKITSIGGANDLMQQVVLRYDVKRFYVMIVVLVVEIFLTVKKHFYVQQDCHERSQFWWYLIRLLRIRWRHDKDWFQRASKRGSGTVAIMLESNDAVIHPILHQNFRPIWFHLKLFDHLSWNSKAKSEKRLKIWLRPIFNRLSGDNRDITITFFPCNNHLGRSVLFGTVVDCIMWHLNDRLRSTGWLWSILNQTKHCIVWLHL